MNKKILFTLTLMMVLFSSIVMADVPLGAETIDEIRSERVDPGLYEPAVIDAIAGNLTELDITGVTQTRNWQGFFGNVSGTIILEDASGSRFYDWTAAEPQGQVYASTVDAITWTEIACADFEDETFRSTWYTTFGMLETDYDNILETYNETNPEEFYVGYTTIGAGSCNSAYTFVNDERQTEDFPAVLLADGDGTGSLIFTAIIEDRLDGARGSKTGYDGNEYDFQLLVAENGTGGNSDVTPYYFWVELS